MNMKKSLYLIFALFFFPAHAMEQPKELNIFEACEVGDVARVRELIKAGVAVDSACPKIFKNLLCCTPLMIAAAQGHFLVVMELVKAGANIHLRSECETFSSVSHTALGCAVIWGGCNTTAALLQFGADVNDPYYQGFTYIKQAILTNKPAMCRLLVQHGADLRIRDALDLDAFGWAAAHNRAECLKNIVCSSFCLPIRNQSWKNNLRAPLCVALSFLPYWSNMKPSTPAQRIKMFLFCLKKLSMPKDIQKLLLRRAASEDIIDVLANQLARNKKIPLFALNLMVDACYDATIKQLLPALQNALMQLPQMIAEKNQGVNKFRDTNLSIALFLDPAKFEENYGDQLRANIRARLANSYQYMNEL